MIFRVFFSFFFFFFFLTQSHHSYVSMFNDLICFEISHKLLAGFVRKAGSRCLFIPVSHFHVAAHEHAQSSFIVMVAFKRWKIDRSVNWVGNCIDLFYSSHGMSEKICDLRWYNYKKIYNIIRSFIFRFLEYRKKYFKILKKNLEYDSEIYTISLSYSIINYFDIKN